MKKDIHPKYGKAKITCISCGNSFYAGSTRDEISVELCANCHPHYTGKQVVVDTDNRVKKFKDRMDAANLTGVVKKRKKVQARKQRSSEIAPSPKLTLKDMLKQTGQ